MSTLELRVNQFCRQTANASDEQEASRAWRRFMLQERVVGLVAPAARRGSWVPRERHWAVEAICATILDYLQTTGLWEVPNAALEIARLFRDAARVLESGGNGHAAKPEAILTALYEGEIKSVSRESVTVEFEVGDDLEQRCFARKDLTDVESLEEGAAIQARCQLELVPPAEPMDDAAIAKWKEQYRDVEGYLDKPGKGRSLPCEEGP